MTCYTNTCRELGIGIVPYGPLGGGFFGGKMVVESISENSLLVIRKMLHELFILGSQKKKEPYFEPWFNIYVLLRFFFSPSPEGFTSPSPRREFEQEQAYL